MMYKIFGTKKIYGDIHDGNMECIMHVTLLLNQTFFSMRFIMFHASNFIFKNRSEKLIFYFHS